MLASGAGHAYLPPRRVVRPARPMTEYSLDTIDAAVFRERIGSTFLLGPAGGERYPLVLAEAALLGHRRAGAARDPFSLTFRGPSGLRGEQGIHRLEHPELGVIEIFLVQLADKSDGSLFEAIFT